MGSAILVIVLLQTITIEGIPPNSSLSTLNPAPLIIIILLNPTSIESASPQILQHTVLSAQSPLVTVTQRSIIRATIATTIILRASLMLIPHLTEIHVLLVH